MANHDDNAHGQDTASGVNPGGVLGGLDNRALFEAVPDGIAIVGQDGRIQEVNGRFQALFGYSGDDLLGLPVENLIPKPLRETHRSHRARYAGEPYTRPMGVGLALEGRHRDGHTFPVEVSLSPLTTGRGDFVVCSVRDVREQQRLRRFSAQTLRAAEDERLRVAQELHDDTAQQLSALLLRLNVARRLRDPHALDIKLGELRDAIQRCAEGVRRIARGLRPPALQDVGVVAAIRSHLTSVEDAGGLSIEATADSVEALLSADAKLVLYRVVQEAVSNIGRHAHASWASVSILHSDQGVRCVVEDDGVGFVVPESGHPSRGLGLMGMEERVASVGGNVEVASRPGRGTRITVEIPIEPEAVPNA